jgi:hypothetical protein
MSPRVAHEWVRLSDADKQRMADSMTVVRDTANKRMLASLKPGDLPLYDAAGRVLGTFPIAPLPGAPPRPTPPPPAQALVPVSPAGIPDYLPATSSRAYPDADNHLWVALAATMLKTPDDVFDVIDRSGMLIDRVQPPHSTIAGFGKGGLVYVFVRTADGTAGHLERLRMR